MSKRRILSGAFAIAAILTSPALANGLGENTSWQFETTADKVNQAAIVENKHLGAALAHIRERQDAYEPAWNADRRPATRNNLRRAADGSGLTSLSGADP